MCRTPASNMLTSTDWRVRYERTVKPAARPYVVLRTMGPVSFVFDLRDTEDIDPKNSRVPDLAVDPFPVKGSASNQQLENLRKCCFKAGIQVEERDLGSNVAGAVRLVDDRMRDFHIVLNSKHSVAQRFGTLAHELAHVLCGHLGAGTKKLWPDRAKLNLSTNQKEFEAEMVAYLFTTRCNIEVGSVGYLAGYFDGTTPMTPLYSLDTVLKADLKLEQMAAGILRIPTHALYSR